MWDGGEGVASEVIRVISSPTKAEEVKRKLEEDSKALEDEFLAKYPQGIFKNVRRRI